MSGQEDAEERVDPSVAIWAKQKQKEKDASIKQHEAKNTQLDQVRKQVKLDDSKKAMDTWAQAEAGLKQALRSKRQASAPPADEARDNGLRKHGQAVMHRRVRDKTQSQQALQGSPPLQRTLGKAEERNDLDETMEACSSRLSSPCVSPTSHARLTGRNECFERRSQLRLQKSASAAEKKADHERRRVRTKVASVLLEVRKRQELHEQQEKSKKFREQRYARGRGAPPGLGDSTGFALGLSNHSENAPEQAMTSPRRTELLKSLTLEDLNLLRDQTAFFFTGNAIAAAMTPDQVTQSIAASRSLGALPSVGSMSGSETGKAPKGLWLGAVDASVFEDLIEFFSVSSADKALDVSMYVRNLRVQLLASAGRQVGLVADTDWRRRLCRGEPEESQQEEQLSVEESLPKGPLEMMPCLGRHPPVRADMESPTLLQVREVFQRREEQDSKWVEARSGGIARRLALNAFKAREQQRELLLQDFKQNELHKVRMLQAEEKKAMMDAETQERTEVMGIQKIHRLMVANDRAERLKEEKRDQAQLTLQAWHEGVERATQHIRKTEWEARKDGERRMDKYVKRLTAMGEGRQNVVRSQGQKNDELKTRIQCSLSSQLKEQQIQDSLTRAEAYKTKLDNAAVRRQFAQLGSRYCLVEKAFGANSVGFDAKHHSVAVDRRGKSWRDNSEAWAKMKTSFSAPELPAPRPLSPGGALTETEFNALMNESRTGFKTETSAVALA